MAPASRPARAGRDQLERAGERWALTSPTVDLRAATLVAYVDGVPSSRPLTATPAGDRVLIDLPAGRIVHVVARTATGDILVTRRTARAWW